jgi:hypothetical protein
MVNAVEVGKHHPSLPPALAIARSFGLPIEETLIPFNRSAADRRGPARGVPSQVQAADRVAKECVVLIPRSY